MFRKRRISQISRTGQLLRTRQLWGVVHGTPEMVTKIWQRHRGPKNVLLAHRWLMFQKVQSGPTCHANPPRSEKVQSWEIGNANTPRSQKVQSWPTGNANRQPPYWWCLVCRTASRGASSLGCLRKSRWSKFVVEMWIFKIDLKFRFEFFVVVCNHAHTIFRTQGLYFQLVSQVQKFILCTFLYAFFWGRFLDSIFHRFFDHRFFGLISCVKIRFFSRSRCINAPVIPNFWCSELPSQNLCRSKSPMVIPVRKNTLIF